MRATAADVSVLIVNYRSYAELARCLAAAAAPDAEVIVVDHQSDPAELEPLRRRFAGVEFLPVERNEGFAAGINRAAARTSGRYLLLLNPDTLVTPLLPATLMRALDTQPDAAVAGPRILNEDGTTQASARRFPDATTALAGRTTILTKLLPRNPLSRRNLLATGDTRNQIDVDWVSGACAMIRRSAFEAVGGMDEGFFLYWEDADLCRRLKTAGWRTVYVPGATATHAGGRASRHDPAPALVAFHRSVYRYYRKHGGRRAALLAPLVRTALWLRLQWKLAALRLRAPRA